MQRRCQSVSTGWKVSLVYKAEVSSMEGTKEYLGQASNTFKLRFNGHTDSFRNEKKEMATTLSKQIWKLKRREVEHEVRWNISCLARPYARETKFCQLCNMEKTLIATENSANSLNRRWELMTRCRHRDKHLLTNWVTEYYHQPEVDLQEHRQDAEENDCTPEPNPQTHNQHQPSELPPVINPQLQEKNNTRQPTQEQAHDGDPLYVSQEGGGPMTRARTRARNKRNL